jgi:hypothetical protein
LDIYLVIYSDPHNQKDMGKKVNQCVKIERRKHQRYLIENNEAVNEAVVISPNSIISFCMLDVSRAGLAFCYSGSEAEKWLGKECLLDFLGEDFSMQNIPVRIIDDLPFDPDNLPASAWQEEVPILRRCGVQFLQLSKVQDSALEKYMDGLSSLMHPEKQPSVFLKEGINGRE